MKNLTKANPFTVDQKIIDGINKRINNNEEYFSYKTVKKKKGIHSIARYPATMVPEMQTDILDVLVKSATIKSIYDPFMGSGTVLIEGLKKGIDVWGSDINPYAYLIAKAKTSYISVDELLITLDRFVFRFELHYEQKPFRFYKSEKWFRDDIALRLTRLRNCIMEIKDERIRLFFLIAFSDIITDTKNSRSSTFKLHIKRKTDIEDFHYRVEDRFIEKVKSNIHVYESFLKELNDSDLISSNELVPKVTLRSGDAVNMLEMFDFSEGEIDLVITSPPYGDNQTTVTYGQYSMLPLQWIYSDEFETHIKKELLENYSKIDSASLGGKKYSLSRVEETKILEKSNTLRYLFNELQEHDLKVRKVVSFFIDFYDVLLKLVYITKKNGYLVFVVGNRRVHNIEVKFDDIIKEFLEGLCCEVIDFRREIQYKKIAKKVSRVNEKSVSSMDEETILIFRKN